MQTILVPNNGSNGILQIGNFIENNRNVINTLI